jgi:hypothetical protein
MMDASVDQCMFFVESCFVLRCIKLEHVVLSVN